MVICDVCYVECYITEEEFEELDVTRRVWNVTDALLEKYEIQAIVNCTQEGDTLFLQTTKQIQPRSRIVIPWQLTIGHPSERQGDENMGGLKASLTCPSHDGLFLIK